MCSTYMLVNLNTRHKNRDELNEVQQPQQKGTVKTLILLFRVTLTGPKKCTEQEQDTTLYQRGRKKANNDCPKTSCKGK